jgi:hypothetical protein
MRATALSALFILFQTTSFGQALEMTMDTPQPRVNTTFTVRIDFNSIGHQLFNQLEGKLKPAEDGNYLRCTPASSL